MDALFQSTKVTKIYLLRHGETPWTVTGQHTGLTDIELTKNGEKEAKLLGKSLKDVVFDHVLCSPLKRVRETCRLVGINDKDVVIDDGLLEWNYGDYEGITSKEIHKTNPGWTIFSQDPPGGETALDVKKRIDAMFNRVFSLNGTVALFASGHINRVIGARWLGMEPSFGQHLVLSTGSKCLLGFEHGYHVIFKWNDTSHLDSN